MPSKTFWAHDLFSARDDAIQHEIEAFDQFRKYIKENPKSEAALMIKSPGRKRKAFSALESDKESDDNAASSEAGEDTGGDDGGGPGSGNGRGGGGEGGGVEGDKGDGGEGNEGQSSNGGNGTC